MSETRAVFRRRVARMMGMVTEVTTSAASTAADKFISEEVLDYFPTGNALVGMAAYIVPAEEWRRVSAWTETTHVAQVTRDYSDIPANNSKIEIYRTFLPPELDEAINGAIEEAYPYLAEKVVDTSITVQADVYEYALPPTIRDLHPVLGGQVEWEQNTLIETFPYRSVIRWDIRFSSTLGTLKLYDIRGLLGRTLRLVGLGQLAQPESDSDVIELNADGLRLLSYKAAELLYRSAPDDDNRDRQFYRESEAKYAALFEVNKDRLGVILEGDLAVPVAGGERVQTELGQRP